MNKLNSQEGNRRMPAPRSKKGSTIHCFVKKYSFSFAECDFLSTSSIAVCVCCALDMCWATVHIGSATAAAKAK